MSRRWVVGIGSGSTVVLGGLSAWLINEVHAGWGWAVAAGVVVVVAAVVTGWLAVRATPDQRVLRVGAGAVVSGRDIKGRVRTSTDAPMTGREDVGPGAVLAGRDITDEVTTETTSRAAPTVSTEPPTKPSSEGP